MVMTIIVEAALEDGGVNVDKTKQLCVLDGCLYDPTLTNGVFVDNRKRTVLLITDVIRNGNLIRVITLMP